MNTCSAIADGGEAVEDDVFGTEDEDDLRLLFSLLGTLSISRDNWEDEDVMVDDDDLCLADSTGVILAGESLRGLPAELWNNNTSIISNEVIK